MGSQLKLLLVLSYGIFKFIFLMMFAFTLWYLTAQLNRHWQEYSYLESDKAEALSEVVSSFGYGGFIHHFKNYVLRQDPAYYELARESMIGTQGAISLYLSLDIPARAREQMLSFKKTVDEYEQKLTLAHRLVSEGASNSYVDSQVKVDDSQAVIALDSLMISLKIASKNERNDTDELENQLRLVIAIGFSILAVFLMLLVYMTFRTFLTNYRQIKEFRAVFDCSPFAIIQSNEKGKIVKANAQAVKLFGYREYEFAQLTIEDLIPQKHRGSHKLYREKTLLREQIIEMGSRDKAFYALTKDDHEVRIDVTISTYTQDDKMYAISIIKDRSMEERLLKEARTDSLTGVSNRKHGNEILNAEFNRAKRYGKDLAVVIIDIDFFKKVNDKYGHNSGDKVLMAVAKCLQAQLRTEDTLCRWGGEEFLVIAPEISREQAYQLGEKLRLAVSNLTLDEVDKVTISLGISEFELDESCEHLVDRADQALYLSKAAGRNRTSVA